MEKSDPDDILALLSDEQNRKVITILNNNEMTIRQISSHLGIPQSTTYRKVKILEGLGVIKKTKIIRTIEGSDEAYYKSWVSEIIIIFKDGKISYELKRIKLEDKIVRLWQHFSESSTDN
jgi:predicted transcriptional regulator